MSKLLLIIVLVIGCVSIFNLVNFFKHQLKYYVHVSMLCAELTSLNSMLFSMVFFAIGIMLNNVRLLWIGAILLAVWAIATLVTHFLPRIAISFLTHNLKKTKKQLPPDMQDVLNDDQIDDLQHMASVGDADGLFKYQAKLVSKDPSAVKEYIQLADLVNIDKSTAEQALQNAKNGNPHQYEQIEHLISNINKDIKNSTHLIKSNRHHRSLKASAETERKLAKNPIYIKAVKMTCAENGLDINTVKKAMHDALNGKPDALAKINQRLEHNKTATKTLADKTDDKHNDKNKSDK